MTLDPTEVRTIVSHPSNALIYVSELRYNDATYCISTAGPYQHSFTYADQPMIDSLRGLYGRDIVPHTVGEWVDLVELGLIGALED